MGALPEIDPASPRDDGYRVPRIIADLGGFAQYTWLTTAYIVTSAVTIPIVGKLTDMIAGGI